MVILKRLEAAERDGDRIYAVVKAIGTSSDGKSQSIYAPRAAGQTKALERAYSDAGIDPATVRLIEAHGTGTRVGDAVEFKALKRVFDTPGRNGNKCALGSVKSMIGHTKAAAGAAGLIKTALALYHKVLPPTLKAATPDPDLAIESSPFYLNTTARPWLSENGTPRRAGVSAFGFGGSNFHVVLEEYGSGKSEISWDGAVDIAAFSDADPENLAAQLTRFRQSCQDNPEPADRAFQTARSRREFSPDDPCRLTIILERSSDGPADAVALIDEALEALRQKPCGKNVATGKTVFRHRFPSRQTRLCLSGSGQPVCEYGPGPGLHISRRP